MSEQVEAVEPDALAIRVASGSSEGASPKKSAQSSGGLNGMSTIIVFTVNVLTGLVASQLLAIWVPHKVYKVWYELVRISTMWCLAFIMINVGHEFVIDTKNMRQYGVDYLIAMTAAGFPWIFVAAWFMWVLPNPLPWDEALLAARFAAPTSAGVLFCMLEAAGLKETWLFKKARILAIFDDLDTILLMIPLKAVLAGFKWEVAISLVIVIGLTVLAYKRLHRYLIPLGWKWTLIYALLVTALTEVVYYVTKKHIEMEAVHIEVLLPAFVLGAICREHDSEHHVNAEDITCLAATPAQNERANFFISAGFMVLVGLSMPSFLSNDDDDSDASAMGPGDYIFHVTMISLLMVLGKMFPVFCYRSEADLSTRFALALGMCPRGEVGAGVIVVSLALGVKGSAVPVAICSLALNIGMSGFFILATTKLVHKSKPSLRRRGTHLFEETSEPSQSRNIAAIRDVSNVEEEDENASQHQIAVAKKSSKSSNQEGSGMSTIIVFTVNVLTGLIVSQVAAIWVPHFVYHVWYDVVRVCTMWCLAFIMINVGHEFVIDTKNMRQYGVDYLIAMTAAGFPWIFVAAWFLWALPNPLPWDEALLAARFAAPTSAGVLFCMLEAAGLKETWLFKKARILAIFDDLDTILLMIPLKAVLAGFKWEVAITLVIVVGLVVLAYKRLHYYLIPLGWKWTLIYALLVTALTEIVYYITKKHIEMEAVHIEVLLPAFVLGAIAREHDHEHHMKAEDATCLAASPAQSERASGILSALFMVLVGLSMPGFLNNDDDDSDSGSMGAGGYVFHVAMVSFLMVIGKMFPVFCYRSEADLSTRFALALGMCPRGEVGAGVIVISLALGVKGNAVPIAICSLALNIAMSGFFILAATKLVNRSRPTLRRRQSHLFDECSDFGKIEHDADEIDLELEDSDQFDGNEVTDGNISCQPRPLPSSCEKDAGFHSKCKSLTASHESEGRTASTASTAACSGCQCKHCGAPINEETGKFIGLKDCAEEKQSLASLEAGKATGLRECAEKKEGKVACDIDDIAIHFVKVFDESNLTPRYDGSEDCGGQQDSPTLFTI